MNTLISTMPYKRGLTPSGEAAFLHAYCTTLVFPGEQAIVRFKTESTRDLREIAQLRMKSWKTTTRWNQLADVTGLLGELAVQRFLGIPGEQALEDFVNGLNGDKGYDLISQGERVDVKSTMGQALKFKFSKFNRERDKATAYSFVKTEEEGGESFCYLLGWAKRQDIQPWIREDERSRFVRYQTLKREGILRPITQLKQQALHQPIGGH